MLNFHRDLQWRNMRNQAFFEQNLCKVLKPIIWADTKFEQNGKMGNSIERWQKLQAEVHISYMINTSSPNLTKSYASLVIMQKIKHDFPSTHQEYQGFSKNVIFFTTNASNFLECKNVQKQQKSISYLEKDVPCKKRS